LSDGSGWRAIAFYRIQPYVKNEAVVRCPSDTNPWLNWDDHDQPMDGHDTPSNTPQNPPRGVHWMRGSYGYNSHMGYDRGVSIARIARPAEAFLSYDASYFYTQENHRQYFTWNKEPRDWHYGFEARHTDQVNMLYADGHVKTVRCAQVFPCGRREWTGGDVDHNTCWDAGWSATYITDKGTTIPKDTCPQ
ncbi:MAG TPA: H-X9-DG-CTERM domain-containing protein, partial [Armatimonadota bacterium]|nr:H-X9-DG-CTERM domain-containing protein [Armatimonadota bacterium]